jgi:Flp pilus assembly pilin Flp
MLRVVGRDDAKQQYVFSSSQFIFVFDEVVLRIPIGLRTVVVCLGYATPAIHSGCIPWKTGQARACLFTNQRESLEDFMLQKSLIAFLKEEEGQDVVEYSLLLVLIAAASIFLLTAMGTSISQIFSKINTRLSTANSTIS